jgi:hypothetical protein
MNLNNLNMTLPIELSDIRPPQSKRYRGYTIIRGLMSTISLILCSEKADRIIRPGIPVRWIDHPFVPERLGTYNQIKRIAGPLSWLDDSSSAAQIPLIRTFTVAPGGVYGSGRQA